MDLNLIAGKRITPDDHMVMTTWSSQVGVVEFSGELVTEKGELESHSIQTTVINDRLAHSRTYKMPPGVLTHWQCRVVSGNIRTGQCFAKAFLRKLIGSQLFDRSVLFGDYANLTTEIVYPGNPQRNSIDGPGHTRTIHGTQPAPGVELHEAVPVSTRWRLIGFRAFLQTGPENADRFVRLFAVTAANLIVQSFPVISLQKKNEKLTYNWVLGQPLQAAFGSLSDPYDNLFLPGLPTFLQNYFMETDTVNLQATDQWSRPVLAVQEWIEV